MNNLIDYKQYQENLLQKVKNAILELEPEAEIFLFGSRARGDFNEESDWDLLIILPGKITFERKSAIVHVTNSIEVKEGELLSRIYFSKDEWLNNKIILGSPFYDNISKEAIQL